MQTLLQLSDSQLRDIASALYSGRVNLSSSELSLCRYVGSTIATKIIVDFQNLVEHGFDSDQVALLLDTILRDRKQRYVAENFFDLVATSPESKGILARNTGTVVRELFAKAKHSVLVAGYAVYQGRHVFQSLAERMSERPELILKQAIGENE